MKDTDLVDVFTAHLKENGYPGLKVDEYPDKGGAKGTSDVDGIAGPFAIEVTSIDTVPNQRRYDDWFSQVIGGLRRELFDVPFRLRIIFEHSAIKTGQDWPAIRQALRKWIIEEAPLIQEGNHLIQVIPEIPCLRIRKGGRRPGVIFARSAPDDDTLPKRMRELIDRKVKKLAEYHRRGKTTILLLDGWDSSLMNQGIMFNAMQDAYPQGIPSEIDQIWFAYTDDPDEIDFIDFTSDLRS
jgi:hypothetical protein